MSPKRFKKSGIYNRGKGSNTTPPQKLALARKLLLTTDKSLASVAKEAKVSTSTMKHYPDLMRAIIERSKRVGDKRAKKYEKKPDAQNLIILQFMQGLMKQNLIAPKSTIRITTQIIPDYLNLKKRGIIVGVKIDGKLKPTPEGIKSAEKKLSSLRKKIEALRQKQGVTSRNMVEREEAYKELPNLQDKFNLFSKFIQGEVSIMEAPELRFLLIK